jgi:hypothetical protein
MVDGEARDVFKSIWLFLDRYDAIHSRMNVECLNSKRSFFGFELSVCLIIRLAKIV